MGIFGQSTSDVISSVERLRTLCFSENKMKHSVYPPVVGVAAVVVVVVVVDVDAAKKNYQNSTKCLKATFV